MTVIQNICKDFQNSNLEQYIKDLVSTQITFFINTQDISLETLSKRTKINLERLKYISNLEVDETIQELSHLLKALNMIVDLDESIVYLEKQQLLELKEAQDKDLCKYLKERSLKVIKDVFKESKYDIEYLAKQTSLPPIYLDSILTVNAVPTYEEMNLILKALDITLDAEYVIL